MAFATADEVGTRLGRALTSTEQDQINAVLDLVTGLIAETGGVADSISPVPFYFKALCIEKATAIASNPEQLTSLSEKLGAHESARSFRTDKGGSTELFLTEREEFNVRRIANGGRVSGSVRPHALPHDAYVTEPE